MDLKLKIFNILVLFVLYYWFEVWTDFAMSKDSKGGFWNKLWHKRDLLIHLTIAVLMAANAHWLFGLLVFTSRGLFFDKHFAYVWKGDWFYIGKNEPEWKKRNTKPLTFLAIALYLCNLYAIFAYI